MKFAQTYFGWRVPQRRRQSILGFRPLMAAGLACLLLSGSLAHAQTVGYWQFGDDPGGFLADSGPNGLHLTDPIPPLQASIPGAGPGSTFNDTLVGNTEMADFPVGAGGGISAPTTPDVLALALSDFTIEAFVNINRDDDDPAGTLFSVWHIAAQYDFGTQRSWSFSIAVENSCCGLVAGNLFMNASLDGSNATTSQINSGFDILVDKDYHLAAAYDSSAGTTTFYAQNLTDGTAQALTIHHGMGVLHNSTADLTIGALNNGGASLDPRFGFRGVMDEVRLSNVALSNTELLVPAPAVVSGDFDGDFDVDGADFLKWQRDLGDATNLALWQDNFGTTAAAAAAAIVPEPASWVLLCTMAMASARWRRRS